MNDLIHDTLRYMKETYPKGATVPTDEPMLKKIQEHLPHIKVKEEVPVQSWVAICIETNEQIPFAQKLARAIQDRFCPVKIFPLAKLKASPGLTLLLIPNGCTSVKPEITIFYSLNRDEKKELWQQVCSKLQK